MQSSRWNIVQVMWYKGHHCNTKKPISPTFLILKDQYLLKKQKYCLKIPLKSRISCKQIGCGREGVSSKHNRSKIVSSRPQIALNQYLNSFVNFGYFVTFVHINSTILFSIHSTIINDFFDFDKRTSVSQFATNEQHCS
jgi:hypothetical protein